METFTHSLSMTPSITPKLDEIYLVSLGEALSSFDSASNSNATVCRYVNDIRPLLIVRFQRHIPAFRTLPSPLHTRPVAPYRITVEPPAPVLSAPPDT